MKNSTVCFFLIMTDKSQSLFAISNKLKNKPSELLSKKYHALMIHYY